jgi:predicted O-methyltransferase YrrM
MDELHGRSRLHQNTEAVASEQSTLTSRRDANQERARALDAIFAAPVTGPKQPAREVRAERTATTRIAHFVKTYARALKDSAFILLAGPLTNDGRRAIENVSVLASSVRAARSCPTVEVPAALVPMISAHAFINLPHEIVVEKAEVVHGNVSLLELLIICKMVKAINPALSFEIGTFDGRTTLNIAANSEESAKVLTLDLPRADMSSAVLHLDESDVRHIDKDESGSVFAGSQLKSRITQLFGDSAKFDFSKYRRQVGLVFIDGSHSYEYVLSDSRNAVEMLSKQGVIFWHDYGAEWWPGVTQALNELYQSDARFRNMRYIEGTSLVVLWRNSVNDPRP